MTGAEIRYTQNDLSRADPDPALNANVPSQVSAQGGARAPLDGAFAEGDTPFKVVAGVATLTTRDYNAYNAKYGSAWNWCQAYGLRLVTARQRDDGKVEVTVEEMAAHLARGKTPDGQDIPLTPDAVPGRDAGARIIYS